MVLVVGVAAQRTVAALVFGGDFLVVAEGASPLVADLFAGPFGGRLIRHEGRENARKFEGEKELHDEDASDDGQDKFVGT